MSDEKLLYVGLWQKIREPGCLSLSSPSQWPHNIKLPWLEGQLVEVCLSVSVSMIICSSIGLMTQIEKIDSAVQIPFSFLFYFFSISGKSTLQSEQDEPSRHLHRRSITRGIHCFGSCFALMNVLGDITERANRKPVSRERL